ncbi:ABC transporter permease [Pseudomonas typographi]|uniref:ABC transporter permease n=1 Tax=Pseudomonas typographi TaxID=2715964 RepID=UPI001687229A|nr:ABC transporter permease subunit [Pseudomonas typographi]MBD1587175.1 ABC transporter permease subunit [Pseudomonas typographi]
MRLLPNVILLLVLLALWESLHLAVGPSAMASPWATAARLASLLAQADTWRHIGATASAFAWSLLLACVGGVALGMLLGLNAMAGNVAEPILMNLYALPKVTLYPLVLLCFGLGLGSKVAFGVMHGLIPILLFTMNALRHLPPVYMRSARSLRVAPWQTAWHILLPAIAGEVLAGIRLGFALTLLGVLIGEMFASQKGLGYLAMTAMGAGDIATLLAIALLLTCFAVTGNALLLRVGRHLEHP